MLGRKDLKDLNDLKEYKEGNMCLGMRRAGFIGEMWL
jgi:hypothetical protein